MEKLTFKSESELARYCEDYGKKKAEHNGWTNYATWIIRLEMLENKEDELRENEETFEDIYALSVYLKEEVEEYLFNGETGSEYNLCQSYAEAFVSEVNWYEIAENMVSDNKNLIKESER